MPPIHPKVLEYVRTIDADYRDNRILTELEHRCLVWFFTYGQNAFSQFGYDWVGANFRQREEECLLTVKRRQDGTQEVVFVTARTPIDCVRVFTRKWVNDTLRWVLDKYA